MVDPDSVKEVATATEMSLLRQLVAGAVAAIGGVLAWVWSHTMGRIRSLEKNKVDKEDYARFVMTTEAAIESRRAVEAKLFDRLDETNKIMTDKMDSLSNRVADRFDRIMDEVRRDNRR